MCYDVFPKNLGNTSAEICKKQQGKKSTKSLFLTLAAKGANIARILFNIQVRSLVQNNYEYIFLLFLS
jgi:hypothetical protein